MSSGIDSGGEAAKGALKRLALGSVNDCIRLSFYEEPPCQKELEKMDLFNISEIKRVKGGGVEIKFFDRQKALEKLIELNQNSSGNIKADSFFEALRGERGDL